MSDDTREIEAPGGPLRLHRAGPGDEPFQRTLFAARRAGVLRMTGLPEPAVADLLEMQRRARAQSYRKAYPEALWWIAERGGEAMAELIVCPGSQHAHIVDVTLLPGRQGRGLGPALVRSVMYEAGPVGEVTATVAVENEASRKMFARLGFVESDCGDGVNVEFVWRR